MIIRWLSPWACAFERQGRETDHSLARGKPVRLFGLTRRHATCTQAAAQAGTLAGSSSCEAWENERKGGSRFEITRLVQPPDSG